MTTNLEREKYEFNLALEAKKWEYKKQELAYVESGQHIRALNVILWQVPSMAIAITGGLWYGVSLFENEKVKASALIFTLIVDLVTILIIWRLRFVMNGYLDAQLSFQSLSGSGKKKYVVMWCWSVILFVAALLSGLGVINVTSLKRESSTPKPAITSCENSFTLNLSAQASSPEIIDMQKLASKSHQIKCR